MVLLLHLLLRVEVLDHCLLGILLALRLIWEGFLDALVSREGSFLGKMSLGMELRMLNVHLLEVFLTLGNITCFGPMIWESAVHYAPALV